MVSVRLTSLWRFGDFFRITNSFNPQVSGEFSFFAFWVTSHPVRRILGLNPVRDGSEWNFLPIVMAFLGAADFLSFLTPTSGRWAVLTSSLPPPEASLFKN